MSDQEIRELFHKAREEANAHFRGLGQAGMGTAALEFALRKVYEAGQKEAS